VHAQIKNIALGVLNRILFNNLFNSKDPITANTKSAIENHIPPAKITPTRIGIPIEAVTILDFIGYIQPVFPT